MRYLKGEFFEERYKNVEYRNITLDLDDYFNYTWATLRNGSERYGGYKIDGISTFSHKVNFNGLSEWENFFKCFQLSWNITNDVGVKTTNVVYDK